MIQRSRIFLTLLPALLLVGCSVPGISIYGDAEPGTPVGSGEQHSVHFFTRDPNFDTGLSFNQGNRYRMKIALLSNWIDGNIEENEAGDELDEAGFDNSLMPTEWMGQTRRSRSHNWFELMLYQPNCAGSSRMGISELEFDENSNSYLFEAVCDGKLSLYVNDTHFFYINNAGYANIQFSRLN